MGSPSATGAGRCARSSVQMEMPASDMWREQKPLRRGDWLAAANCAWGQGVLSLLVNIHLLLLLNMIYDQC